MSGRETEMRSISEAITGRTVAEQRADFRAAQERARTKRAKLAARRRQRAERDRLARHRELVAHRELAAVDAERAADTPIHSLPGEGPDADTIARNLRAMSPDTLTL